MSGVNPVHPDEAARLCRTYSTTGNASQTARMHSRSVRTVTRHLRLAGVPVKPRRLDLDEEKIVRLYSEERLSLRAIAAREEVSYGTIHRIVADAGVMRKRGTAARFLRPAADPVPVSVTLSAAPGGAADDAPEAVLV